MDFLDYKDRDMACLNPVPKKGSINSRTGKPYEIVPCFEGMAPVCQLAKGHHEDCATGVPAWIEHDERSPTPGRRQPLKAYFSWPSEDSGGDKPEAAAIARIRR